MEAFGPLLLGILMFDGFFEFGDSSLMISDSSFCRASDKISILGHISLSMMRLCSGSGTMDDHCWSCTSRLRHQISILGHIPLLLDEIVHRLMNIVGCLPHDFDIRYHIGAYSPSLVRFCLRNSMRMDD